MNSESVTLYLNHQKILSDLCSQITKDINEDDCLVDLKWPTIHSIRKKSPRRISIHSQSKASFVGKAMSPAMSVRQRAQG